MENLTAPLPTISQAEAGQNSHQENLKEKVLQLKKQKNAVILAHYYQEPAIQDIADFLGDSLYLSRAAADSDAEVIVFAGVYFMAETAKILSPQKKVLLPDPNAGCSLVDDCPPEKFEAFLQKFPEHKVITYINSSSRVKALSDVICTSSNAEKIIKSFPEDEKIIFAPDKNLGKYLIYKTGRDMVLWEGACQVHEVFSYERIDALKKENPEAKVIAHPECEPIILAFADFVGSTGKLLDFVKKDPGKSYIVVTEVGILHQMEKLLPEKKFIPGPAYYDNTCACSECAFMKKNTLEKLYLCLKNERPEIKIPDNLRKQAYKPLKKMLELSAG